MRSIERMFLRSFRAMKRYFLAAASGLVFSAFLIATPVYAQSAASGEHRDADGMPTTHSTPAEQAQTAAINNQVAATNAAADAQTDASNQKYQEQQQTYQSQQQQYRNQLERNHEQQDQYRDRTAAYEGLRVRFAAERAAYHRGEWPDRYARWVIVERDANLVGERVELISGGRVGTVIDTAHSPGGNVEALLVRLDSDKIVWIDIADVRYNRTDGIVMTNLNAADLHHMADERL
jgi:multidrug efflux pump subunit AcrA (membrane-fusion protein)